MLTLALALSTHLADVSLAAIPFDRRRSGMILGSGGIGMVLESEEGALRRFKNASASGLFSPEALRAWQRPFRCRLLGTLFSNSAYHGASMDKVRVGPGTTEGGCGCATRLPHAAPSALTPFTPHSPPSTPRQVHIAAELERFVASLEKEQGITRSEIARHGVYFSHETATHSSPSASCAANEIYGLRKVCLVGA